MVRLSVYIALFVILANTALVNSRTEELGTKKKRNKDRSTSSDSDDGRGRSSSKQDESLDLTMSSSSSSKERSRLKKFVPKSSAERPGWRKWHRKCKTCPEEAKKKWKDPSIKWICGAYQRARRSFKSKCMMQYRNCQDGTMFVKIHDHRCKNDSSKEQRHGDHFFYEYKVKLSDETTASESTSTENSESSSTD